MLVVPITKQTATVMRIIKLNLFPVPVHLHSGYGKFICVIISPFFAIFKNVVHILNKKGLVSKGLSSYFFYTESD